MSPEWIAVLVAGIGILLFLVGLIVYLRAIGSRQKQYHISLMNAHLGGCRGSCNPGCKPNIHVINVNVPEQVKGTNEGEISNLIVPPIPMPANNEPEMFAITRQEIVEHETTIREGVSVKASSDPQYPWSLRIKNKSYAMLYGTEKGVLLIVKVSDEQKGILSASHDVQVAKFPKGKNWFVIPVDKTFTNKEQVYAILQHATEFVQTKKISAPKQ